jgi:hypothetical protein
MLRKVTKVTGSCLGTQVSLPVVYLQATVIYISLKLG